MHFGHRCIEVLCNSLMAAWVKSFGENTEERTWYITVQLQLAEFFTAATYVGMFIIFGMVLCYHCHFVCVIC